MTTRSAGVMGALTVSLCIAVPGTAWALACDDLAVPTDVLKAAGVDDTEVTEAYYATIDEDGERENQAMWEDVNGFNANDQTSNGGPNKIIEAKGYYNDADLAFWRAIKMVRDKRPGKEGNIAFTTVNYDREIDSLNGEKAVSIVNMEYSTGPHGDDRITKFYVFDTEKPHARLTETTFDCRKEPLALPAACFSCHGGDDDATSPLAEYAEGSGETGGSFLLFDARTMRFGGDNPAPPGAATSPPAGRTTLAKLERRFKAFNRAILRTDPTTMTKATIKGLYGGNRLPSKTQDLDYIPQSWIDGDEAELYREVVIPSCLNCHTVSDRKILSLAWWKNNPDKIREEVFHEDRMPNSLPSYNRFFDSSQWALLLDALDRFEYP